MKKIIATLGIVLLAGCQIPTGMDGEVNDDAPPPPPPPPPPIEAVLPPAEMMPPVEEVLPPASIEENMEAPAEIPLPPAGI
jgi:hypothetical protein